MIRALLVGKEPGVELGYAYVEAPPYEAVVIGSLTLGQLLRFEEPGVLEALAEALDAEPVAAVGRKIVLYRASQKKPVIELPKA